MRPPLRSVHPLWLTLPACLFFSACLNPTCDRDGQAAQRYSEGKTDSTGTFYESSDWSGPFLHFPSGRRYRLEHGLNAPPEEFSVFLAFAERPFLDGEVSSGAAESAGNQAIVELIDDKVIQVRNDTCAEFFLRLIARTAPDQTRPDAQDPSDTRDAGARDSGR